MAIWGIGGVWYAYEEETRKQENIEWLRKQRSEREIICLPLPLCLSERIVRCPLIELANGNHCTVVVELGKIRLQDRGGGNFYKFA